MVGWGRTLCPSRRVRSAQTATCSFGGRVALFLQRVSSTSRVGVAGPFFQGWHKGDECDPDRFGAATHLRYNLMIAGKDHALSAETALRPSD